MLMMLASFLFIGASAGLVAWIAFQSERERIKDSHRDYCDEQNSLVRAAAQELRQPLNSIVGLLNSLQTTLRKEALDTNGVAERLDLSLRELNDALLRTLEVVDHSSDAYELDLSPLDVRTEIKVLIRKRNKELLKIGSPIKVVAGYIPEIWVETDAERFCSCVGALLDQAIAQTKEGHVRLSCAVEDQVDGRKRLAVAVKDNGRGMDQRRARSFFNPADYEDNPELRGAPKAMLSLNLAARTAQRLGGSMIAKSAVGVGTTFVLTVTADDCEPLEVLSQERDIPAVGAESPNFDDLSVLLVDDNEINLFVLQEFIMPLGFGRVVTAEGGQKAIDRALCEPFDLILMDLAMPEVDGLAAATRIREGGPSESAPIIAVSGMPMRAGDAQLKAAGIDGFVPKPIVHGDLLAAILRVLPDVMRHAEERAALDKSDPASTLRLAAG